MQSLVTMFSTYWRYIVDLTVFAACLLILGGYQMRLVRHSRRTPMHTVQGLNALARNAWVERVMHEGRDIMAVQTLRNSTMAATLMASTAVILILGILNMLANADKLGPALHVLNPTGSHEPGIWVFKLMLILVDFFVAFFSFSLAVRGYNHVGFLINVPKDSDKHGITPAKVALHLNRASAYYGIGMRTYYFSVPLVLWLFGPVWTLLYALIGVAAWLVARRAGPGRGRALGLWGVQLGMNAAWTPIFFGLRSPGLALVEIAAMWIAIAATAMAFFARRTAAGALLLPYLAWVSFALVLNLEIWRRNS